jgi:hypothetical protein
MNVWSYPLSDRFLAGPAQTCTRIPGGLILNVGYLPTLSQKQQRLQYCQTSYNFSGLEKYRRLNSAIFVFNDHLLQPSAPFVHKQDRRIRGYSLRSLLSTLLERRTRRALQHSSSQLFIHAKSGLRSDFGFTSWIWLLERQFDLDPGGYPYRNCEESNPLQETRQ